MVRKVGIAFSVIGLLLLGAFVGVSQPSNAASGSITIEPGQTKYLSFGTCAAGDCLLWSLDISTWSTIFEHWLQGPAGVCVMGQSTYYWYVDVPGEYKLGFSIDESGWWSATVYYSMYATILEVEIESPAELAYPFDSAYVDQEDLLISGTVDGFADEVAVSLDNVHYEDADLYLGTWNKEVTLPSDGEYTVYAKATLQWGIYELMYSDSMKVTLDTVMPEVTLVGPDDDGLVRDNYVDISWQCSDECGVSKIEMKIDGWGWSTVTGNTYDNLRLSTGEHTIQIRVTDLAGNQAIDSTTFTVDARAFSLDGPYYGLPLIGVILGVAIASIAIVMLLRRRRGGPAITPAPDESTPEPPPESVSPPE